MEQLGSFRGLANAALRVRSFREQLDVNRNTSNVVNLKIPSLLRRGSNFVSHDFVKKTAIGITLRDSNFLAAKLTKGCKRVLKKPSGDRAERDIDFLRRKLLRYKFFAQFDEGVVELLLQKAQFNSVTTKTVLLNQGFENDKLYLLTYGNVVLMRRNDDHHKRKKTDEVQKSLAGLEFTGSKHESEMQFLRSFGRYGDFVMSLGAGDSFGEMSVSSKEGLAEDTVIVASDVAEFLFWTKEDYDLIMAKVDSSVVFRPEYCRAALLTPVAKRTAFQIKTLTTLAANVAFTAQLGDDIREKLAGVMKYVEFNDGEYIFRQGDDATHFFIILAGSARVLVNKTRAGAEAERLAQEMERKGSTTSQHIHSQDETIEEIKEDNLEKLLDSTPRLTNGNIYGDEVCVLHAGDSFGERALMSDDGRAATIQAVGHLEVISISKVHFKIITQESETIVFSAESCRKALHKLPKERTKADIDFLLDFVKTIPFFCQLSPSRSRILCKYMHLERLEAGEPIFYQGMPGESFYIVLSGECNVHVQKNAIMVERLKTRGRTKAELEELGDQVAMMHAGDCFGEQGVQESLPRSASVVCRTKCEIIVIHRREYQRILHGMDLVYAPGRCISVAKKPVGNRSEEDIKQLFIFCKSVRFFRQVSDTMLKNLCQVMTHAEYQAYDVIVEEGQQSQNFYVILSGSVSIHKKTSENTIVQRKGRVTINARKEMHFDGPQDILHDLGPCFAGLSAGDTFGDLGIADGSLRTASICTKEPTSLFVIDREAFVKTLHKSSLHFQPQRCFRILQKPVGSRDEQDVETLLHHLQTVDFFDQLPIAKTRACCQVLKFLEVPKRTPVFTQGTPAHALYIILSGKVEARIKPTKRKPTVTTIEGGNVLESDSAHNASDAELLQARDEEIEAIEGSSMDAQYGPCVGLMLQGDSFGEKSLLKDSLTAATVVAVDENVDLLVLEKEHYNKILASESETLTFQPKQIRKRLHTFVAQGSKRGKAITFSADKERRKMDMLLDTVKAIKTFQDMSLYRRKMLLKQMHAEHFAEGEVLFKSGEIAKKIYFLVQGAVEYSDHSGNTVALRKVGQTVGEVAVILDRERSLKCTALQTAVALALNAQHYWKYWAHKMDDGFCGTVQALAKNPIFKSLTRNNFDTLAITSSRLKLPRNGSLVNPGNFVYYIQSGECRLIRKKYAKRLEGHPGVATSIGKKVRARQGTLAILSAGQSYGDGPTENALLCTTETIFIKLSKDVLRQYLGREHQRKIHQESQRKEELHNDFERLRRYSKVREDTDGFRDLSSLVYTGDDAGIGPADGDARDEADDSEQQPDFLAAIPVRRSTTSNISPRVMKSLGRAQPTSHFSISFAEQAPFSAGEVVRRASGAGVFAPLREEDDGVQEKEDAAGSGEKMAETMRSFYGDRAARADTSLRPITMCSASAGGSVLRQPGNGLNSQRMTRTQLTNIMRIPKGTVRGLAGSFASSSSRQGSTGASTLSSRSAPSQVGTSASSIIRRCLLPARPPGPRLAKGLALGGRRDGGAAVYASARGLSRGRRVRRASAQM